MALTEHGAVNARSFKRLPESDRFVASELEKLKGLPWNLNGSLEAERLDGAFLQTIFAFPFSFACFPIDFHSSGHR